MQSKARVAVIGGGSFGTAIANVLASNGCHTSIGMRNEKCVKEILESRTNETYLPGIKLSENLHPTTDMVEAISEAEVVFVAIPSKAFRDVIRQLKPAISSDQFVVSLTKGVEPVTFSLMSQVLSSELPEASIGVLGGPNLAKEMAKGEITAAVIASKKPELCELVQSRLGCQNFRVYANDDVQGVELGGTLKNIYAIMAGIAAAKGLGENTRAMLMTRSLAEMSRYAAAEGANPFTFLGLAGVGDLIATCSSPLSRNYRVGFAFGSGKTLEQAVEELGEVAEGVNTLEQIKAQSDEKDIYMPLVQGLYRVVFEGESIASVVGSLMSGVQSSDVEFVL